MIPRDSCNREIVKLTPRHNRQHNDAEDTSLGSLLGLPVKLPNGIAEQKQQSNLHRQGTDKYPNWLFGCPSWGKEPNSTQQVWYVGIQDRTLFGMF